MEDYEKFRLNASNVFMFIITSILLIILIAVSVMLIISLRKPNNGLPKLNITSGRATTHETTMTTASTTSSTTKKVIDSSPYYELNVDELLKDDLYKKRDGLTRAEAEQIGNDVFKIVNSLYDVNDYSIFDLASIKANVKEGEQDLIVKDNIQYGELYNYEKLLEKVLVRQVRKNTTGYKYDDKNVIIYENGKYYRMLSSSTIPDIKIVGTSLESFTPNQIIMQIKYYNSNYKELGYNSPNYSTTNCILKYEDGWKVYQYNYPLYK